jgi:hypothetical protein
MCFNWSERARVGQPDALELFRLGVHLGELWWLSGTGGILAPRRQISLPSDCPSIAATRRNRVAADPDRDSVK